MIWAFAQDTKAAEKVVLLACAWRANDRGLCWPSLETLIADTGLSRATVCRVLAALESSKRPGGDLLERRAMWHRGRRIPNAITLLLGQGVPLATALARAAAQASGAAGAQPVDKPGDNLGTEKNIGSHGETRESHGETVIRKREKEKKDPSTNSFPSRVGEPVEKCSPADTVNRALGLTGSDPWSWVCKVLSTRFTVRVFTDQVATDGQSSWKHAVHGYPPWAVERALFHFATDAGKACPTLAQFIEALKLEQRLGKEKAKNVQSSDTEIA